MEEAVYLDGAEDALAELPELLGAVFADVPRIARPLGALRGERQHVGRGDVRDAAGPQEGTEMLERSLGILQVLDRLEKHDRVGRLRVRLDQIALEAEIRAAVAEACVLMRLGVRVDAGHPRRAPRQDVAAVALAARHVDDFEPRAAPRNPVVDDQMTPVPVVLLRHIRQRPLPRECKRRHSGRLVALDVFHGRLQEAGDYSPPPPPCRNRQPRRSWTSMSATTTSRRSPTTRSGASTTARKARPKFWARCARRSDNRCARWAAVSKSARAPVTSR